MRLLNCTLLAGALLASATPVMAQDFYEGNRINVIIAFTPGGGVDAYGRLVARHMSQHIPGNPEVVPQNMPGAAGMTAIRAAETTLPQDGTAIVVFAPGILVESIVTPEQSLVDFSDLNWLGSIGQDERICYTWHTFGAPTWEDIVARDEVIMGDNGGGQARIAQRILDTLLDVNMQIAYGYPGTSEKRLAVENGELDGDCGAVNTLPAEWIADELVHPFIRFQEWSSTPQTEQAAYIYDLIDGDHTRQVVDLLMAGGSIGRPFVVSGEVPDDRVELLREAFASMVEDPEFQREAAQLGLDVTYTSGADLQALVSGLYASSEEVIASANAILTE